MRNTAFDKNTVEFVTVASRFCTYIAQHEWDSREDFIKVMTKLLPLLYLKASLLDDMPEDESYIPISYVTEELYESIRCALAELLGEKDSYLELYDDGACLSEEVQTHTISEDLADLYQPLQNYLESYRSGIEENMNNATAEVRSTFTMYWGQRLISSLGAMHKIIYNAGVGDYCA